MANNRPTQRDVARAAGVSQTVVSYVLNDVRDVALHPDTRKRVLAAIAELGYVPNHTARSLRSRRTRTIAAIIPDITNPFYPAFIRGVQDVARAQHHDVLAFNSDGDRSLELDSLQAARRASVDGIVMTRFFVTLDDLVPLLERGTPITLLSDPVNDEVPDHLPLDTASISGNDAAFELVSYLIDKGHNRIAMISGTASTPPRDARVQGYRQALESHHLPLEEVLIRGGDFTESGGYEAMREILQLDPRPTAVFASNDLMAMGALLACREQGLRVPDDIALAGFDDIPAARLVQPPLTTVDQHAHATGHRTAELLLSRLSGEYTGPPRHEPLGFALVPRESA